MPETSSPQPGEDRQPPPDASAPIGSLTVPEIIRHLGTRSPCLICGLLVPQDGGAHDVRYFYSGRKLASFFGLAALLQTRTGMMLMQAAQAEEIG